MTTEEIRVNVGDVALAGSFTWVPDPVAAALLYLFLGRDRGGTKRSLAAR